MVSLKKTGAMTIRHLLTMTSGFTYDGIHNTTQQETKRVLEEMNREGGASTREFARRLAQVPLLFEPGTAWNYGLRTGCAGSCYRSDKRHAIRRIPEKRIF